jgi:hypothetical protein
VPHLVLGSLIKAVANTAKYARDCRRRMWHRVAALLKRTVGFTRRAWGRAYSTIRPLLIASFRALRLLILNWWFALVLATLAGSYVLINLASAHRPLPPRVFIALYPDAQPPALLQIDERRLLFGFPSARGSVDINIFLNGVTVTDCTNFDAGAALKTGVTKDFAFTAATTGDVVRITLYHPNRFGFFTCDVKNIPQQRSFITRIVQLQLDSVLWLGHLTNNNSDYLQETEQRIGKAANDLEVGFPSIDISEFVMSGGLPSQFKYPSPRELFLQTVVAPPLSLAPNRVRLDALENPLVTAEWQDDPAKEKRDVILLIAGTLLGTAGAALIEWAKSAGRRLRSVASD